MPFLCFYNFIVLIINVYDVHAIDEIGHVNGKVIAIIHRINDNDDKLVVVPENKYYSDEQIIALTEFQEQWFKSKIIR